MFEIPRLEAVDIDEESDFRLRIYSCACKREKDKGQNEWRVTIGVTKYLDCDSTACWLITFNDYGESVDETLCI